uniref:Uncharacterized protein n=1 Tax=viral metagenome TaxID=1070528 RepID=A0A6C0D224_9ZZZZ
MEQHQKKIKKIKNIWLEGVNSICVFEVMVNGVRKVLIFLGETHYPYVNGVQVERCPFSPENEEHETWNLERMVTFLEGLLPSRKKLEIFFEFTFPLGSGQKMSSHHRVHDDQQSFTSFLASQHATDLVNRYSPKYTLYPLKKEQQQKNKLRVHVVDVRDSIFLTKHLKRMDDSYITMTPGYLIYFLKWKRDRGSVYSLEEFLEEFLKDTTLEIPKRLLDIWNDLLKLTKQWDSIQDEFWKESLRTWLFEFKTSFIEELKKLQEVYRKDRYHYQRFAKSRRFRYLQTFMTQFIIIHENISWKLVDFYCLCRIFRTFSDGKTTEFGLVVTGYYHFYHMFSFLQHVTQESAIVAHANENKNNLCVYATDYLPLIEKLFTKK